MHVILGNHNKSFVCRQGSKSYKIENILTNQKKLRKDNICTIRTSSKTHLYWKKQFHKNPFYSRTIADFEADNEIDNSNKGTETTNIYKEIPVPNSFYILTELRDVLKSGYYESPLGYNNVDWFGKEDLKLENKMAFLLKILRKKSL